jgi:hypothetical protein
MGGERGEEGSGAAGEGAPPADQAANLESRGRAVAPCKVHAACQVAVLLWLS